MTSHFINNKFLLIIVFSIFFFIAYIFLIDIIQGQSSGPREAQAQGPTGPPTEPDVDTTVAPDQPNATNQTRPQSLLQSFMNTNGSAYQVISMTYLLGTYFNKTGIINPEIICSNIIPDSNKIKINAIDCSNVLIFLNIDVQKINSTTFTNRFPELYIFNNLYYQFTFLPEIIKIISKSDKFYCSKFVTKQFDLSLSNCTEFSIFFRAK
jgi:hypothetical protein